MLFKVCPASSDNLFDILGHSFRSFRKGGLDMF